MKLILILLLIGGVIFALWCASKEFTLREGMKVVSGQVKLPPKDYPPDEPFLKEPENEVNYFESEG